MTYQPNHKRPLVTVSLSIATALLLLAACAQPAKDIHAQGPPGSTLPHLVQQLQLATGAAKGVLDTQHQVHFLGDTGVARMDGTTIVDQISLPNLNPPYGQNLRDLAVNPHTGLVYVLDQSTSVIHVISNTTVLTTLVGITEYPLQVVADEDSGEMYVFYTSQKNDKAQARVAILAGTHEITDIVLPLFSSRTARYNPIDGHIYVAGYIMTDKPFPRGNALIVIDNHQLITTIHPLDEPQLAVADITINAQTGDVYTLLDTKVVYWDRVHPPKSIDLYKLGYTNPLQCMTVDPKRGWAYVCSWMAEASHVLVIDKAQFVAAIPVAKWPAALAVDAKHDYVYVGHYDPTKLSVIRGTELITTLNIVGYGTAGVIVDQDRGYVYTANGDDRSVDVFSFDRPIDKPSRWQTFLAWIGK